MAAGKMSGARESLLAGANLLQLSPDDVDEGVRIGFLHEDIAQALGRTIAQFGQRDPIKVVATPKASRPWRLVTGMHRLVGCRIEGISVLAVEVRGTAEQLEHIQASENVERRNLAPIERAMFVDAFVQATRAHLAEGRGALKQQQIAIKARWDRVKAGESRSEDALTQDVNDTHPILGRVYGWEDSAVEAFGMSRSAIHRDLQLARLLVNPFPDLIEALERHPIVGKNAKQLSAIAQVRDENARRQVIETLIANPEIGADDARVLVGLDRPAGPDATPVAHQKHFNAIKGGWGRLGVTEKRQFLRDHFVGLLTNDLKRELRDRLNEELGDD